MVPRLGQILVDQNVLTDEQVEAILAEQSRTSTPFGLLSERLFGVSPVTIEQAWARQYAHLTRSVDPEIEVFEAHALSLVTRRQAWQFRVLPIRFEEGELLIASSEQHLRRALRFATKVIGVPVFLVVADAGKLGAALCRHYPIPGMSPESIHDESMDQLLSILKPAA